MIAYYIFFILSILSYKEASCISIYVIDFKFQYKKLLLTLIRLLEKIKESNNFRLKNYDWKI